MKTVIFATMMTLSVLSCGKEESNSRTTAATEAVESESEDLVDVEQDLASSISLRSSATSEGTSLTTSSYVINVRPHLYGRYDSESCTALPSALGGIVYFKRTYNFGSSSLAKPTWKLAFSIFQDANCTFKLSEVNVEGTYSIGGYRNIKVPSAAQFYKAINAEFAKGWAIDLRFGKRTATPASPESAGYYNAHKICGFSDWKVGVAKNIHTSGCAYMQQLPVSVCPVEYDLFKVRAEGPSELYFGQRGADGNICSVKKRPTSLNNLKLVYNKGGVSKPTPSITPTPSIAPTPVPTMASTPSPIPSTLAAPSNLKAEWFSDPYARRIRLTWTANATNVTGYILEKSIDGAAFTAETIGNLQVYLPVCIYGKNYNFRIKAVNGTASSGYSNVATYFCN